MINIKNTDDNECVKWSIVRYLNPADDHSAKITKVDNDFAKKLDFKGIKFPVKIRNIYKIEKIILLALVFIGYENKEKHPIYVSQNVVKKNILIYY